MRNLLSFAAAATLALVVTAPGTASAVPVPPPDEVTPEECSEMGLCPPTHTADVIIIGPGGVGTAEMTCSLQMELTVQVSMYVVVGHIVIWVTAGATVCDYGLCGVVVYMYGGGGIGTV